MENLIITAPMLAACILANANNLPPILEDALDLDEIQSGDFTSIAQYFTECSNWDALNTTGNFYLEFPNHDENHLTQFEFTILPKSETINCKSLFKPINDFSDWVARSYDNDQYPWENTAWDEYCTGDDDVDYNSSYLDCVVAMIELYLVTEKYTSPELTTYLS